MEGRRRRDFQTHFLQNLHKKRAWGCIAYQSTCGITSITHISLHFIRQNVILNQCASKVLT